MPVMRTDGRSVAWSLGRSVARSLGHVITKFSGIGRFIYPWCSAGALRARSSANMLNKMENTSFLERLSCILHAFVAKGYQGYKSNFGFRVPFDREIRQFADQNPFLDSPKGTHPR